MRVYYLQAEYLPGKHKILIVWSKQFDQGLPEDSPDTTINVPYSVLELDDKYNRQLCYFLLRNSRGTPEHPMPDRYYVDNTGQLRDDAGNLVVINDNPEKTTWVASILHNVTPAQIDAYFDTNVTTVAQAREALKKLAKIVVLIARQIDFE